ncbi:MAG: hypothetical protein IIA83_08700 [Thaumarchaeota archaeon]|nr:hypothetical protein [Nitrososphaerota archaeon]
MGVFELGNAGGPIAAAWLRSGEKVIGVDISKKLLSDIIDGKSHTREPSLRHYVLLLYQTSLRKFCYRTITDAIQSSGNKNYKFHSIN